MKMLLRLGLIILLLCAFTPLPKLAAEATFPSPDVEPLISMDFQDANLKDVLKVFSIQAGMNFLASEGVNDRKLTLYMDKVPLNRAMDKLFSANNLSYVLDSEANIFVVKDWGKPTTETITKVYYLKYATVSVSSIKEEMSNLLESPTTTFTTGEGGAGTTSTAGGTTGGGNYSSKGKWAAEDEAGITYAVKKLLSSSGSVIEDYRTNSLVVTDTPMRMEVISQVIASLDVATPQALLEVEMLDVSKAVVDQLGVNWPTTLAYLTLPGSKATSFPFGTKLGTSPQGMSIDPAPGQFGGPGGGWDFPAMGAAHFMPSIFTFLGTTLTFDYLRTRTDSKYLARPRIMTLNNETAEIRIATNESIGVTQSEVSTGGTGTTTAQAERSETGVILRITPQINVEAGEITMFVYPKVATTIQGNQFTVAGASYQYRDPEERSTKQVIKIKDGETIVIGGLIRNQSTEVEKKLPILGDLPLIGAAFRHKSKTPNEERELLVFITPHILKDGKITGLAKVPVRQAPVPQREQSTASAMNNRQSAINRYISTYEK